MGRDTKYYSKGKLKDGCSVYDLYPEMVKYFKNIEDSKVLSHTTLQKVNLICVECGCEKQMRVNNFINRGFKCDKCSDKISIPEKFCIYLFKELGLEFNTQKIMSWSCGKRYDFYFNMNNEYYCCETHGMQHYKYTGRGRTLQDEQKNDLLKYNLAIENGIKLENYIVIDCRYSEFEWLKENCIKQLGNIFDLSNVDWLRVWEKCQSSLVPQIWDAWNNRSENNSTVTIGKMFGLNKSIVRKYLNIGVELNKCKYSPDEEMKKVYSRKTKHSIKSVKICQYNIDGSFINLFNSVSSANKNTSISKQCISDCVNEKRFTAGGFIWKRYVDNLNDIQPYIKKSNLSKTVIQYDFNYVLISEFESAHEAMRNTGINFSDICAVCRGRKNSAGGFKWKYKETDIYE